jgi:Holliday junction resolvase-like predicted endonuclease
MVTRLEIKLLELTKNRKRISTADLAKDVSMDIVTIQRGLAHLRESGFVTIGEDVLEQSSGQRMLMVEKLIQDGCDVQRVSRLLDWQEFEEFIENALVSNGYRTIHHYVFKSKLGRREIDVLAWNDVWILAIDCKHWRRQITHSRMNAIADAQIERVRALAERTDLLQKCGIRNLDLSIVAVVLVLGEPLDRMINGVPVVAVTRFGSFLHEGSPYERHITAIEVKCVSEQTSLLALFPSRRNRRPNLRQDVGRRQP